MDNETPLCPIHAKLDREDKLEVEYSNRCVACSLNERTELLRILAPLAPEDQSKDSVTVLTEHLFAPGEWVCPKCGFRLHSRLLRASDMAVGIDQNRLPEQCANDCGLMRPLTWKESDFDCGKGIERLLKERDLLLYWLLRAYVSGHRQGWEEGPTVNETMMSLLHVLANFGYEPESKDAEKLLAQEPVYFINAETEAIQ